MAHFKWDHFANLTSKPTNNAGAKCVAQDFLLILVIFVDHTESVLKGN